MTEEQYQECAQRFFDAGCSKGERVGAYKEILYFGWSSRYNQFFHGSRSASEESTHFNGRELTYFEIMEKEFVAELPNTYSIHFSNATELDEARSLGIVDFKELLDLDSSCYFENDDDDSRSSIRVIDGVAKSWKKSFPTDIKFEQWKDIVTKKLTTDIWKTAPKEATHYSNIKIHAFYQKCGDKWFYYEKNNEKWILSHADDKFHEKLIPRPIPDGHKNYVLPPIGNICEAYFGKDHGWRLVEILKHNDAGSAACYLIDSLINGGNLKWSSSFRPIKSEREKAIEKMVTIVGGKQAIINCEQILGKIYDAGLINNQKLESI